LSQSTRLTDRQTDRWADTFLIASPRWHSMQCGKKRIRRRQETAAVSVQQNTDDDDDSIGMGQLHRVSSSHRCIYR